MGFYNLTKEQRVKKVQQIHNDLHAALRNNEATKISNYFSDEDTYIRKTAYQSIGILFNNESHLREDIIAGLEKLLLEKHANIRQTTINAAGEIGMKYFATVEFFFDRGLLDEHHTVRNAVIGSIKKMGQKNPEPVLHWAKKYLHHPNKEIRREICHGIELRGRTHPEDILPLLKELQHDQTARVKTTLIHVLGQISYKKGCLAKVVEHLKTWENKDMVSKAINEITDVHERYKDFAAMTASQAKKYIDDVL
jgi:HEAT repeat protein